MATQRNVPSSSTIDPARKSRIIDHMNNDHQSDISMYLQHYSHLPPTQADTGLMTDLTLEGMTFTSRPSPTASPTTTFIPFKTPLTGPGDARVVLVEMSGEAAAGLGLSKVKIDSYEPPSAVGWTFGFAFLHALVIFAMPEVFLGEGRLYRRTVLMDNEGLANVIIGYHWIWFTLLLGTHLAEAGLMTRKMRRYRVRDRAVWWKWVGTAAVVGFDSFGQLKRVVEAKRH